MLINQLMFWTMILEAIVCLILSLPVGQTVSIPVVTFLSTKFANSPTAISMGRTYIAIVALLFLSDVFTTFKYHNTTTDLSDGLRLRIIAAQRDMYISGFSLFLLLLLRLVYIAMAENIRLNKSFNAMKKQAEGASKGYSTLLSENESIQKQLKKLSDLAGDDTSNRPDVLASLIEENASLTTKYEESDKKYKKLTSEMENLKKQVESQSKEYMRMVDTSNDNEEKLLRLKSQEEIIEKQMKAIDSLEKEKDALKSQIQDYDFMFLEAKKKAN